MNNLFLKSKMFHAYHLPGVPNDSKMSGDYFLSV